MNSRSRRCPPYNTGVRDLVQGKRKGADPLSSDAVRQGFGGWHENGYLPHRDEPGLVQFVTFRLADAFPLRLRAEWKRLMEIEDDRKRRIQLENYLDRGRGECQLRRVEVASVVEDALRYRHGKQYELRAWVIMPNHVHVMFTVWDVPMARIINAWKGFSAKAANRILGRTGTFWQEGYWDTYMRDAEHELRTKRYIETNPVRAGLIQSAKLWQWGSARYRDEYEQLKLEPGKSS